MGNGIPPSPFPSGLSRGDGRGRGTSPLAGFRGPFACTPSSPAYTPSSPLGTEARPSRAHPGRPARRTRGRSPLALALTQVGPRCPRRPNRSTRGEGQTRPGFPANPTEANSTTTPQDEGSAPRGFSKLVAGCPGASCFPAARCRGVGEGFPGCLACIGPGVPRTWRARERKVAGRFGLGLFHFGFWILR